MCKKLKMHLATNETKRVLVTGGAGFLGTHLVSYLLRKNYRIVILNTPSVKNEWEGNYKVQFFPGNILSLSDINTVFTQYGPFDIIYHLAAALPNKQVSKNDLWSINVTGTKNLVKKACDAKVRSFIFTSSNTVYGTPSQNPVTEKTPLKPIEIYGKSKVFAEKILNEYKGKINIQIFRCPVISGVGRLGLQALLYEFISENKKVYMLDNGNNKYQFVDAHDLCIALEKANTKKGFSIYNIGADNILSLKDLYKTVIAHAKSRSKIVSIPKTPAIVFLALLDKLNLSPIGVYQYNMLGKSLYADTTKVKKELHWTPKKTNIDMFIENYDWYIKNKNGIEVAGKSNKSANRSLPQMGFLHLIKYFS